MSPARSLPMLALLLAGCGASATDTAQQALTATTRAYAAASPVVLRAYTERTDEAREQADGWDEYDALVEDVETLADAWEAVRPSLVAAQLALDAWRAGREDDWMQASACAVAALGEALAAAAHAGVELPDAIHQALSALLPLAGGVCRG